MTYTDLGSTWVGGFTCGGVVTNLGKTPEWDLYVELVVQWLMVASVNMSTSTTIRRRGPPRRHDSTYLKQYVSIKSDYELTVEQAEQGALAEATADC